MYWQNIKKKKKNRNKAIVIENRIKVQKKKERKTSIRLKEYPLKSTHIVKALSIKVLQKKKKCNQNAIINTIIKQSSYNL